MKYLPFTVIFFLFSCAGITDPSLKVVGDTLIKINPSKYEVDKNGFSIGTSLPGGVGFSYYYHFSIGGSVQILTSNDSLAGVIKKELYDNGISFTTEDKSLFGGGTLYDIRYDHYYLPKYFRK
jgi:hypothetical protein